MGNRQNLPHSQLTETKPKQQKQPLSEKVISHFYRKIFARPVDLPRFSSGGMELLQERFEAFSKAGRDTIEEVGEGKLFYSPGGDGGLFAFAGIKLDRSARGMMDGLAEKLGRKTQYRTPDAAVNTRMGAHCGRVPIYKNAQGKLVPTGILCYVADQVAHDISEGSIACTEQLRKEGGRNFEPVSDDLANLDPIDAGHAGEFARYLLQGEMKPEFKPRHVKVKLEAEFDSFTDDDKEQLVRAVQSKFGLKCGPVIVAVSPGSVEVVLKLPGYCVEDLVKAAADGKIGKWNVLSIEVLDNEPADPTGISVVGGVSVSGQSQDGQPVGERMTLEEVYAKSVSSLEKILNAEPGLAENLVKLAPKIFEVADGHTRLADRARGFGIDLAGFLKQIEDALEKDGALFELKGQESEVVLQIVAGVTVLGVDPVWAEDWGGRIDEEAIELPGHDSEIYYDEGKKANFLAIAAAALERSQLRLEEVFSEFENDVQGTTRFFKPETAKIGAEVFKGTKEDDQLHAIKVEFIKFVYGSEHDAGLLKDTEYVDGCFRDVLERMEEARTEEKGRIPYKAFLGPKLQNAAELAVLIKKKLKMRDLYLMVPTNKNKDLINKRGAVLRRLRSIYETISNR